MIWVNCIFGLLLFTGITCSPTTSHEGKKLGAPVEKNPKDPKYLELANLSMKKYKSDLGSKEDYSVFQVTRATEQVVAGLITKIEFYVLESSRDSPNGYIIKYDNFLTCHSSVLDQPWLPKKDITVSCKSVIPGM